MSTLDELELYVPGLERGMPFDEALKQILAEVRRLRKESGKAVAE